MAHAAVNTVIGMDCTVESSDLGILISETADLTSLLAVLNVSKTSVSAHLRPSHGSPNAEATRLVHQRYRKMDCVGSNGATCLGSGYGDCCSEWGYLSHFSSTSNSLQLTIGI